MRGQWLHLALIAVSIHGLSIENRNYLKNDECSPQLRCPRVSSGFWSLENLAKRAQATSNIKCGMIASRLCEFQEKLHHKKQVKIAVLGGSFTAGTFLYCEDAPDNVHSGSSCAWPKRLETKLMSGRNISSPIQVVNLAHGGTTTFWAVNAFHRIPTDVDMVIVDYDVNDGALLNDFPNRTKNGVTAEAGVDLLSQKIASGSEVLARWISSLPNQPALLWIDSFAYDGRVSGSSRPHLSHANCYAVHQRGYSVSKARKLMLDSYGISSLSLRNAVWPTVQCPVPADTALNKFWECTDTCHHPTVATHQLVATWVAQFLTHLSHPCCKHSNSQSGKVEQTFPSSFITPYASDIERVACRSPKTILSAIDHEVPLSPKSCWDRKGKFGWIASNCLPEFHDMSIQYRMNFSATLPRLTITYLETYHDVGSAWLEVTPVEGSTMVSPPTSSVQGCGIIDGFNRDSRYSQEVQKTFWFSTLGSSGADQVMLDNAFRGKDKCRWSQLSPSLKHRDRTSFEANVFVHFNVLSEEDKARRGGDKVKIISLVSC